MRGAAVVARNQRPLGPGPRCQCAGSLLWAPMTTRRWRVVRLTTGAPPAPHERATSCTPWRAAKAHPSARLHAVGASVMLGRSGVWRANLKMGMWVAGGEGAVTPPAPVQLLTPTNRPCTKVQTAQRRRRCERRSYCRRRGAASVLSGGRAGGVPRKPPTTAAAFLGAPCPPWALLGGHQQRHAAPG